MTTDTTTRREWTDTHGYLVLSLELEDARCGYHQGACDADIADLRRVPYIAAQLAEWDAPSVAGVLKEYGAWDAAELADHDANLDRLLWLACGDIVEEDLTTTPEEG